MAKILPLNGKYYGTKIEVKVPSGGTDEIVVWVNDHFEKPFASEREIANGWDPKIEGHDHVESALGFRIAKIIEEALTKEGL